MKIAKLIFCFVFVLFAAVQYNDVDPYLWVPIYLIAALVCLLSYLNRMVFYLLVLVMVAYGIGFAYYVPSMVQWLFSGMPSITGTMKAESPFIELIREALGLLICFIVMGVICIDKRKKMIITPITKIPS